MVKPLLSGPSIKRMPFIKQTLKSWSGAEITHLTYLQGAEINILYLPSGW